MHVCTECAMAEDIGRRCIVIFEHLHLLRCNKFEHLDGNIQLGEACCPPSSPMTMDLTLRKRAAKTFRLAISSRRMREMGSWQIYVHNAVVGRLLGLSFRTLYGPMWCESYAAGGSPSLASWKRRKRRREQRERELDWIGRTHAREIMAVNSCSHLICSNSI